MKTEFKGSFGKANYLFCFLKPQLFFFLIWTHARGWNICKAVTQESQIWQWSRFSRTDTFFSLIFVFCANGLQRSLKPMSVIWTCKENSANKKTQLTSLVIYISREQKKGRNKKNTRRNKQQTKNARFLLHYVTPLENDARAASIFFFHPLLAKKKNRNKYKRRSVISLFGCCFPFCFLFWLSFCKCLRQNSLRTAYPGWIPKWKQEPTKKKSGASTALRLPKKNKTSKIKDK